MPSSAAVSRDHDVKLAQWRNNTVNLASKIDETHDNMANVAVNLIAPERGFCKFFPGDKEECIGHDCYPFGDIAGNGLESSETESDAEQSDSEAEDLTSKDD